MYLQKMQRERVQKEAEIKFSVTEPVTADYKYIFCTFKKGQGQSVLYHF